jgi:hypothetical protein
LRDQLDSATSPEARKSPQVTDGGASRPQGPASPTPGLLFRQGERVRNAAGEIGTVLSDVKPGDTEMMVDIGGDYERERIRDWHKI